MLISYEPLSDVLNITFQSTPATQTQMQGTMTVGFDATGAVVSVAVPEASTLLFERGGQVNVMLPETQTVVVTEQIVERRPTLG
jgi:uncharacterized protein YuzE